MFINKHLCLKKGIYLQTWPKYRGIRLSPSEMKMRNSILQALLARICLIKECVIYSFTPVISVLFEYVKALLTVPA